VSFFSIAATSAFTVVGADIIYFAEGYIRPL
jgi:hypothetical protein